MDMHSAIAKKVFAAGLTGMLMAGGIGIAAATSHDAVPEVPEAEIPELPEGEIPELPEGEIPEVPEAEIPELPEAEVPEAEVPEEDGDRGPRQDNFGARVSADARGESDGVRGVDGQQISAEARAKGQARRQAR